MSADPELLALYRREPWLTRVFLRGRLLLSDMDFVERRTPVEGKILELGCGHGLFANLLALRSPRRRVTGIDLDPKKIAIARATIGGRPNIDFASGDATSESLPLCDAVAIIDVLYLLPFSEQRRLISACAGALRPGGLLIMKAQERRPRWKYAWTYLQELAATGLGLTKGGGRRFYFMSREEALRAIGEAGLAAEALPMRSRRPYTDVLYLGRKTEVD